MQIVVIMALDTKPETAFIRKYKIPEKPFS